LGQTFGTSTQGSPKFNSKPKELKPCTDVPGPGSYDIAHAEEKQRSPSAALVFGKPKVKNHFAHVPGPGHYDVKEVFDKPVMKNLSGVVMIGKPKSEKVNDVPAPNHYDLPLNTFDGSKGVHLYGKRKEPKVEVGPGLKYNNVNLDKLHSGSPKAAVMIGKPKPLKPMTIVPGPGAY
jgi:hypothetical protein